MKITTVLYMVDVEPSLDFFTTRLGFDVTVTVPDGDKLGFVILQKGDAEVMLQSHRSGENDVSTLTEYFRNSKACLFIEVEDFDDLVKRIEGVPVAVPVRNTFYGMTEIGVFEPGGNFLLFAAKT